MSSVLTRVMCAMSVVLIAGCYYKDPYADAPRDTPPLVPSMTLQRVFFARTLGSDGLAHDPADSFEKGGPIYVTAIVTGDSNADLQLFIRKSEDGADLAAVNVVIPSGRHAIAQDIGPDLQSLAPGKYFASVVVNGVPSWGLTFELDSAN